MNQVLANRDPAAVLALAGIVLADDGAADSADDSAGDETAIPPPKLTDQTSQSLS